MAAIADLSDLINRSTGGASGTPQNVFFEKNGRVAGAVATTPIAGRLASLWRYDGWPAGGAVPGAVEIPDNTTVGALPFTSPGGGRESWLTQFWITGLTGGTLILYDRLMHIGGLSGTNTAAQTVQGNPASPAITRNTGGVGNFAFIEIHTQIGSTATTVTMEYEDQDGNANIVSPAVAIGGTGFREVTRAIMLPLASGDRGIRSIESVDLVASTATAGNFGVVLGRPLAYSAIGVSGAAGWRDFTSGLPGIPKIDAGACLSLLWVPISATVPTILGGYSIVEA
jgi:hypothetical protein